MKLLLSVIIPTYNRLDSLKKVLYEYDQQVTTFSYEVIVVDDGSTDDTSVFLFSYTPINYRLKFLRQSNSGPGSARNYALTISEGDYILFTGDDIIPTPNFIDSHINTHLKSPKSDLAVLGKTTWYHQLKVNSVMSHIDGVGAQQFGYKYLKHNSMLDFRHFYTSNISIKSELIKNRNFHFDTNFSLAAFEDIEFAYRLFGTKKNILYRSDIVAYHNHYYTISKFCVRQFNAGQMAVQFFLIHSELSSFLGISKLQWKLLILNKTLNVFQSSVCKLQLFLSYLNDIFTDIDLKIVNQKSLNSFYIAIFQYYYYSGILSKIECQVGSTEFLNWLLFVHTLGQPLDYFYNVNMEILDIYQKNIFIEILSEIRNSKTFRYNCITFVLRILTKVQYLKSLIIG